MKRIKMRTLFFALITSASFMPAAFALAQSGNKNNMLQSFQEETIYLKNDNSTNTIEIKDGKVFVNGKETMALPPTTQANVSKKIVIESSPSAKQIKPSDSGNGLELYDRLYSDKGKDTSAIADVFGGNSNAFEQMQRLFKEQFEHFGDANGRSNGKAMLGVQTEVQEKGKGALVKEVVSGSAAEKAGLKSGDRIVKVKEQAIGDATELVKVIGDQQPGDKVAIAYLRNGKKLTTIAELDGSAGLQSFSRSFSLGPDGWKDNSGGTMPNTFNMAPFGDGNNSSLAPMERAPQLGISAEDAADATGVKVLDVQAGSAAAAAGIQKEDVIQMVGQVKVNTVNALQKALTAMEAGVANEFTILRKGQIRLLDVTLPREGKKL